MALKTVSASGQTSPDGRAYDLVAVVEELQVKVTALATLANEIKADLNAHVHGGVTAGGANTSALGSPIAAPNVTI